MKRASSSSRSFGALVIMEESKRWTGAGHESEIARDVSRETSLAICSSMKSAIATKFENSNQQVCGSSRPKVSDFALDKRKNEAADMVGKLMGGQRNSFGGRCGSCRVSNEDS